MYAAVLDFAGFQLKPFTFIIKELAFLDVYHGYHCRWTFLPPHPWENLSSKQRKTFSWLMRNGHSLDWESGDLPYSVLQSILSSLCVSYSVLYIKGLEKSKFLENLWGRKVWDLNEFHCPKIEALSYSAFHCPDHPPHFRHCAFMKVAAYGTFIKENISTSTSVATEDVEPRTPRSLREE